MGRKVTLPLDAKSTVIAIARLTETGAYFPTQKEWDAAPLSEEGLRATTRRLGGEWLDQVGVEYTRDANKVVRYASIQSKTLPVSACVLSPAFWKKFEPIFGPKMYVALPNRGTIYIFPEIGTALNDFGKMVLSAYHSSEPKVSVELFELSEKGLRAVGVFEE